MFDYPLPKTRKAGRRKQLNKYHRKRRQWLPKSELLIACWKDLEMREQRGW